MFRSAHDAHAFLFRFGSFLSLLENAPETDLQERRHAAPGLIWPHIWGEAGKLKAKRCRRRPGIANCERPRPTAGINDPSSGDCK